MRRNEIGFAGFQLLQQSGSLLAPARRPKDVAFIGERRFRCRIERLRPLNFCQGLGVPAK
jgi:hypothetical protein